MLLVLGAFLLSLSPTLCSDETSVVSDMTPTAEALSRLGEKYRGEGFSIYPPKELKFAGTRKVGGSQSKGWTHPDGIGFWSFSVTTTRSAGPSKENSEKTEAGMKETSSATILIPEEHANEERLQVAKADILSFERSE